MFEFSYVESNTTLSLLFSRELATSKHKAIRSNVLSVLADLSVVQTQVTDP